MLAFTRTKYKTFLAASQKWKPVDQHTEFDVAAVLIDFQLVGWLVGKTQIPSAITANGT